MRILAWSLLALVVVILAAVGGAFLYLQTLDKSALARLVANQIEAATGRVFQVSGLATLEFGVFTRIVLSDVSLANADWAGAAPPPLDASAVEDGEGTAR